jgi:type I restriction enzyme M protein
MPSTRPRRSTTVSTLPTLADRLIAETSRHGLDRRLILPPAALAVLLLGLGENQAASLNLIAERARPAHTVREALEAASDEFDYLNGSLDPLTRLLAFENHDHADRAVSALLRVLAAAGLPALAEHPLVAGDLLGPLYTAVMAPADRTARGAFYTPPALAQLLAAMTGLPHPGQSVSDPCSGTAGLAIAMVRAMRAAGRAPELVHWKLQDLDGLALALAGVQLAAHGIPHVTLTHGNTLAQAAS